jgi:hypothetical protein
MVQKLSDFLGTSFSESPVDSAGIVSIIGTTTILLDSGTSGNYVKTLTGAAGLDVTAPAHALAATISIDSDHIATRTGTQTLTNKTINLSNNTLVTTLSQLSAAVSGDNVVGTQATQTIANKTLTSPTINGADINGPLSINDITTFGLRDVTNTDYETLIVSNNASPALTADRTLTLDINNANRDISLTGDLTLGGDFSTTAASGFGGPHSLNLITYGNSTLYLPTSGILVSRSGSTQPNGTFGSASKVPVLTVNNQGLVDSIGEVSVAGVSSLSFDSAAGALTINTADGGSFVQPVYTQELTRTAVSGSTGISYNNSTGVISTNDGAIVHDNLSGFVGNEHIDHTSVTLTAGTGLAGGGTIAASRTFSIDSSELHAYFGGAGKGMDADLLDGQHGSHYRIDVYDASGTLLN